MALSKYSNSLIPLLSSCSEFHSAANTCADLSKEKFPVQVSGLRGSLSSFFLREFVARKELNSVHNQQYNGKFSQFKDDIVIIASSQKEADECESDLNTVFENNADIYKLPWWGMIPYRPVAKGASVFGERAGILSLMAAKNPSSSKPRIFILTLRSLLTVVPPAEYTRKLATVLRKGQEFDVEELAQKLVDQGYLRVSRVGMKGEFALRGEVLDIFMPGQQYAIRILFDFDTIENIKYFDIETQATRDSVDRIIVYPMKEVVWTDEFVEKLEKYLEDADSSGIENDYAGFDLQRKGIGRQNNEETSKSIQESTDGGNKSAHLALTENARKEKERILTELSVNHESEGEELFYGVLFDSVSSPLDYFSSDTPVFFYDFDRISNGYKLLNNEFSVSYRTARQNLPVLEPEKMLLDYKKIIEETDSIIALRSLETMSNMAVDEGEGSGQNSNTSGTEDVSLSGAAFSDSVSAITFNTSLNVSCQSAGSYFGNINYLKEQLIEKQNGGWHIYVYADNANQALRVKEIIKEFTSENEEKFSANPDLFPLIVIPQALTSGFSVTEEKILVIQENEIFGRKKNAPKSTRRVRSKAIDTFVELNPGDYIVHVNYGIGQFKGIERIKAMGTERDYIKLEYADEEFVFVPIEQVNMVQRYIGSESDHPKLDRIGSKSWSSRKAKVQAKVEEMAEKLIDLYSKRKASRGFAFPKDTEWGAAFEAAFPYEDTPDQFQATQDIKTDMEKPVPMDRLVCGDVGYGKTEIAMRAAFKAVMGGKQVAFLAPTTILAEQHYENCRERFKNFPVTVAQLSRFVSPSEQKKVLAKLEQGQIDVLVGTHRIIQKDVIFKDLGLMIIDEEQRFGVKDKEKLKTIKTNIDSLAMSATPIPRTLNMSLLNIRDMSLLTTPPQNRHPIETAIEEYNDEKVAKAIRNEVSRGGQVFYLHNRVETLEDTRKKLENLVPEMMVDVAHGQMTSEELDDIFRRFKMGGFHILVATTIIENGIDIPNVNTIIIDRADMYGVSQLYQLRGRVGRSDRQAYAYLFYPENKALSDVAMKRLQVISDFNDLGAGFKIAMKDMEIRGAGNLLGKDQSGEVYAVGFEMYLNMLNSAIERLSKSDWKADQEVLLELEYTGFIPDSYIADAQIKMEMYKKIAGVHHQSELEAVWAELYDRFGNVPEEVTSLLSLAKIRIICNRLSISSLKEKGGKVRVEFAEVSKISVDKLLGLIKSSGGRVILDSQSPNQIIMMTGSIGLTEKADFIKEKLEYLING